MASFALGVLLAVLLALALALPTDAFLSGALDSLNTAVAGVMGGTARAPTERAAPANAPGVDVADFSETGLPKVRVGARVIDLVNGMHWDDLQQDTPDAIRPPSAVAFYDSNDAACMKRYDALKWDALAETQLPARERLLTARYDMHTAPIRAWYKFTPEMDLAKRFKVSQCPEVVFTPRSCNGWTEWCERGPDPENPAATLMGCENFTEQCTNVKHWDGEGDLKAWVMRNVRAEGEPQISKFFGTYAEQGLWMQRRDHTTTDNHLRNIYLAQAFPAFTHRGFKPMPIPPEFNEWLLSFYERNVKNRRTEFWDAESTQMSFHETPTGFLDMDRERFEKDRMANLYLKPLVEEWTGLADLELTSFYGMREYPDGAWLKNHVDRIDTHVLSLTISVKKLDEEKAKAKPWPLEVVQWSGDHVRYEHPAGTLVLYESSKLPHGRPYKNEGGVHVGCFAHFKPRNMHTEDAGKWDGIVRDARAHQRRNSQQSMYRSTASVEPENPVFADQSYGEGTKWKHLGEEEDPSASDGSMAASFVNGADRVLDVFWSSHAGDSVHQGTVAPGASFQVNTYRGHRFFWAEHGQTAPVPGGHMTMEHGRSEYRFAVKR